MVEFQLRLMREDGTDEMHNFTMMALPRIDEHIWWDGAWWRVVTVNYSFWDFHGGNFKNCKSELPPFDQAICALVEDLHERGLDQDCTVLAWGEFGRTPKINKDAGRDHWPRVSCALMAGGGMRTGQAIGATDRLGGEPASRPVTFEEVHATLYRNLGIHLASAPRLFDFRGRPQYLVSPDVKPIAEVI